MPQQNYYQISYFTQTSQSYHTSSQKVKILTDKYGNGKISGYSKNKSIISQFKIDPQSILGRC